MVSKGAEYWNGREECGGQQRAVIGPVVALAERGRGAAGSRRAMRASLTRTNELYYQGDRLICHKCKSDVEGHR